MTDVFIGTESFAIVCDVFVILNCLKGKRVCELIADTLIVILESIIHYMHKI